MIFTVVWDFSTWSCNLCVCICPLKNGSQNYLVCACVRSSWAHNFYSNLMTVVIHVTWTLSIDFNWPVTLHAEQFLLLLRNCSLFNWAITNERLLVNFQLQFFLEHYQSNSCQSLLSKFKFRLVFIKFPFADARFLGLIQKKMPTNDLLTCTNFNNTF